MKLNYITVLVEDDLIIKGYINSFRDGISEYFIRVKSYKEINFNESRIPRTDIIIIQSKIFKMNPQLLNYFRFKGVKVATWSTTSNEKQLLSILQLNLDGYFIAEMEQNDLRIAFENIIKGNKYVHPYISTILLNEYERLSNSLVQRPIGLLTKREWEILDKMTNGYSNNAIANELNITDKTVKNHVSSILQKLKTKDRTNAVIVAIKNKWVNVNEKYEG
jgi:two-component system, NarL family, response regulator DegU